MQEMLHRSTSPQLKMPLHYLVKRKKCGFVYNNTVVGAIQQKTTNAGIVYQPTQQSAGFCWNCPQRSTSDRVSTTPGNPGNLLEFVWSSWKFLCKMSMIDCIGFSHDKTGYRIAYLRRSPFFIFATAPMLCISCFCSIFRQTSRFGTLHSRPKQCKHVLDFS